MASTFFGVQTALRGILAQQRALEVAGHNVTNAGTTGFTRQVATLQAASPYQTGMGLVGAGVSVASYQRVRDNFIDIQLRAQTMKTGFAQAQQDGLQQIDGALNEPGTNGINSLLSKFSGSLQDVANTPEDAATRSALVQNATALTSGINDLAAQIGVVTSQTALAATTTLDEINSVGDSIAKLNAAIVSAKAVGDAPNDLLDQRDTFLDKLGSLVNVSWTEQASGAVDVTVGGGALVTGLASATLAESDLTSLTSGKLGALVQLRDTTLPGYLSSLNAVAKSLADKMNAQHALGHDNVTGAAGAAFFTYTPGSEASTIDLSAAIAANPQLIAASDTLPASAGAQSGNGGNAIAMANLVSDPTIAGGYIQLVNKIGSDTQQSSRELANSTVLSSTLSARRQSVSGVSLDEEMTNLIKFQRGFQAASRAMNTMDDMIDIIINRTGRAGL